MPAAQLADGAGKDRAGQLDGLGDRFLCPHLL
jgi:hypothetical protein